ncbi:hypothetical protein [Craterilacuibacter sp. RT1T]|uniref:hypothetical protein n=1 Tax=Craterilacuibacter sp. RT1T TaxID=2942211 RepID=UPI0020C01725|nr:hypothetical protein [Craterilacuibacter sp. RT1T]MCL6264418.1 hypothetical protein [Craterilacuibacter sp. RT1T]
MRSARGFSLLDLMLGITLALIVLAGVGALYVVQVRSSSTTLKTLRLNADLQAMMDVMTAELRRAGYWHAQAASAPLTNPFSSGMDNLDAATPACVRYSYDRDSNGQISADERLGFKLQTVAGVKSLRMKTSGSASLLCSSGNWESLSDGALMAVDTLFVDASASKCVNVTRAQRTDGGGCAALLASAQSGDRLVEVRLLKVRLAGYLLADPSIRQQLESSVQLRNPRVFTAP